jgi:hypothetical protein
MLASQLEQTLGTVCALLEGAGKEAAAELVRTYPARCEQTGFDNWNGGTELWEVFFEVPAREFAKLGGRREELEKHITQAMKTVLDSETQDWYSAAIIPAKEHEKGWRDRRASLPKVLRNNIIDGLRLEGVAFNGNLNDVEFLSRLYELEKLPSYDPRFKNSAGDIWQHCINNDDWDRDWIYSDSRFDLLDCPTEEFLRFLCEIVHPVVRPDRKEALKLVSHFNDQLRYAGYEIYEEEYIAGRPRFAWRTLSHNSERTISRAKTVADSLDAGWMAKAIKRLERGIEDDPELVIGTAKDLAESCCKTILSKRGVPFTKSDDLGDLTKKLTKELKLVPEGITDEVQGADNIRHILRSLAQITNHLARLRGLYGTGHGRDGKHKGLQPRHARLAVASAVAFIDFIAETYRYQEEAASVKKAELIIPAGAIPPRGSDGR